MTLPRLTALLSFWTEGPKATRKKKWTAFDPLHPPSMTDPAFFAPAPDDFADTFRMPTMTTDPKVKEALTRGR